MADIIVIAGTSDAKDIIYRLAEFGINVLATVTTSFGSVFLEHSLNIEVREGKLDMEGISALIRETGARLLVDASHPFAREASINAIGASERTKVPYIRYEREIAGFSDSTICRVKDFKEAAKKAASFKGNIFLTVGSNNLEAFVDNIPEYKHRLFIRVLPDSKVLSKCELLGFNASNIIALKGPFTEEMNIEMLKYSNAAVLVTKDSGRTGGTEEKLRAAKELNVPVVMVERPEIAYTTMVHSFDEVLAYAGKLKLL